jgi:hypothetical protein
MNITIYVIEYYDNPTGFDGLRFSRQRAEGRTTGASCSTGTWSQQAISTLYLGMGSMRVLGGVVCKICSESVNNRRRRRRFFAATELKAMLAHVVLTYDVKAEMEGERPPDDDFRLLLMPNQNARIFRKRMEFEYTYGGARIEYLSLGIVSQSALATNTHGQWLIAYAPSSSPLGSHCRHGRSLRLRSDFPKLNKNSGFGPCEITSDRRSENSSISHLAPDKTSIRLETSLQSGCPYDIDNRKRISMDRISMDRISILNS